MAEIKLFQGGDYVGSFNTTQQNNDTIDFPTLDGYVEKEKLEDYVRPYISDKFNESYTKNEADNMFVKNDAFDSVQEDVDANTNSIDQIVENIQKQAESAISMTGVFKDYASKEYVNSKTSGVITVDENGKIKKDAIPGLLIDDIVNLKTTLDGKATQEQISDLNTLKTQIGSLTEQRVVNLENFKKSTDALDLSNFKESFDANVNKVINETFPERWRNSFIKLDGDKNVMDFKKLLTDAARDKDTNAALKEALDIKTSIVSDGINSGITMNPDGSMNYDQTFKKAVDQVTSDTISKLVENEIGKQNLVTEETLSEKLSRLKIYDKFFNNLKDQSNIEDILLNDSMLEGVYNIAKLIIKLGIHYIDEGGKIYFYPSFENAKENFDK